MGFSRGSDLANELWHFISEYIPEEHKQSVAIKICNTFEDYDCDTLELDARDLYEAAYPDIDDKRAKKLIDRLLNNEVVSELEHKQLTNWMMNL